MCVTVNNVLSTGTVTLIQELLINGVKLVHLLHLNSALTLLHFWRMLPNHNSLITSPLSKMSATELNCYNVVIKTNITVEKFETFSKYFVPKNY